MCGLAGYLIYPSGLREDMPSRLRTATAALKHRGPDQTREFIDSSGSLGMGFTRLSIIDLSERGRQPMFSEDGNLVLMFNGEIYNYLELRAELSRRGHRFHSLSDSEVLLHLYEQFGADMLDKLDGMYAFAIYDQSERELFVARDRFGKKPLYYAFTQSGLYWASEFRALVSLVPEALTEDLSGFYHYVTFNCFPREFTFFREIRKLLPSHSLRFNLGRSRPQINKYYELALSQNRDSHEERDERLRKLFSSAVTKRLMSDVPIGFFLSGGIDSSAIVLEAAKHHSPINTFSIALEGDSGAYDETPYARMVAERCGARHFEFRLSEAEYGERVLETAWALDEPLNLPDAGLLGHLAEKAADRGIKVLMSGEGGDEIFFGYAYYWQHIKRYYEHEFLYKAIPGSLRDAAKAFLSVVSPGRFDRMQTWLRGRERYLGETIGLSDVQKRSCLAERVIQEIGIGGLSEALSVGLQRRQTAGLNVDLPRQLMLNEFNIRLPDVLMMRIDRVTMSHSVETRNPFMDRDLVEYALSIPFEDLFDGRRGKVALRRALRGLLPIEIMERDKLGFGGNAINLTKPHIASLLKGVVCDSAFLREYFNAPFLNELIQQPVSDNYWRCYSLWNVVTFALWKQKLDILMNSRVHIPASPRIAL